MEYVHHLIKLNEICFKLLKAHKIYHPIKNELDKIFRICVVFRVQ